MRCICGRFMKYIGISRAPEGTSAHWSCKRCGKNKVVVTLSGGAMFSKDVLVLVGEE